MLEEGNEWNSDVSTSMMSSNMIVPVNEPSTPGILVASRPSTSREIVSLTQLALPSAESSLAVALPEEVVSNGNRKFSIFIYQNNYF